MKKIVVILFLILLAGCTDIQIERFNDVCKQCGFIEATASEKGNVWFNDDDGKTKLLPHSALECDGGVIILADWKEVPCSKLDKWGNPDCFWAERNFTGTSDCIDRRLR